MNINEKGRNRRFNFIDALIILLVIAIIGVVVYLFVNNKIFRKTEKTEILYTIRITMVKDELLQDIRKLEKGQNIVDSVRGYSLGKIEKVEITPAMVNYANRTKGAIVKGPYPEYSKVLITVRAEGSEDPHGFDLDGYKMIVGVQVHFRTPYFISYGHCISVDYADSGKSAEIPSSGDTDMSDDDTNNEE